MLWLKWWPITRLLERWVPISSIFSRGVSFPKPNPAENESVHFSKPLKKNKLVIDIFSYIFFHLGLKAWKGIIISFILSVANQAGDRKAEDLRRKLPRHMHVDPGFLTYPMWGLNSSRYSTWYWYAVVSMLSSCGITPTSFCASETCGK